MIAKEVKNMKIKDGFAMRNISGSNIVVPVGKTANEFNGMITLNSTGGFLWEVFCKGATKDEALKQLTAAYDVNEEKAMKDIEKFIEILKENDLVE